MCPIPLIIRWSSRTSVLVTSVTYSVMFWSCAEYISEQRWNILNTFRRSIFVSMSVVTDLSALACIARTFVFFSHFLYLRLHMLFFSLSLFDCLHGGVNKMFSTALAIATSMTKINGWRWDRRNNTTRACRWWNEPMKWGFRLGVSQQIATIAKAVSAAEEIFTILHILANGHGW